MGNMRTATAVGTVKNLGNVASSFKANLYVNVFDENGSMKYNLVTGINVSLNPGETSGPITLSKAAFLEGHWEMRAHVVLDIIAPVTQTGIWAGPEVSFEEPFIPSYGGEFAGTPTIARKRRAQPSTTCLEGCSRRPA